MTVEIILSVLNGERYLGDFLDSLDRQTHADWRLWVRDDGSTDRSVDILRSREERDSRVHIIHLGGPRLGVAGAYGWVLERAPADAAYVMVGDADDVWMPHKIERTLAAMIEAEHGAGSDTPVLVHTDLTVVDEQLQVLAPSFWAFTGLEPEPPTLRRIVVRNVVTAPTIMMNGALRVLVGRTPVEAMFQDWWYALVAAALGRIVAVREPTILYRQHESNTVGARPDLRVRLHTLPGALIRAVRSTADFRRGVRQTAHQARALLDAYGDRLSEPDRRFLRTYSEMPDRGFVRRKIDLLRLRVLPEQGTLRALGVLLRG